VEKDVSKKVTKEPIEVRERNYWEKIAECQALEEECAFLRKGESSNLTSLRNEVMRLRRVIDQCRGRLRADWDKPHTIRSDPNRKIKRERGILQQIREVAARIQLEKDQRGSPRAGV
jgi:hypothetical protein